MGNSRDPNDEKKEHQQDTILTPKEAEAASPDDLSISGEEDPGAALEDLVERH